MPYDINGHGIDPDDNDPGFWVAVVVAVALIVVMLLDDPEFLGGIL